MISFTWGWKDQPDWEEINEALRWCHCPEFFIVDSQSSDFAIVLGDSCVDSQEKAQEHFDSL